MTICTLLLWLFFYMFGVVEQRSLLKYYCVYIVGLIVEQWFVQRIIVPTLLVWMLNCGLHCWCNC